MKVKSILVLSALLVVSNLGLVGNIHAQNTITPGAYFSTAPLVESGIYSTILGSNGSNGTAYYKFNALKGQTIKVSAVFTKSRDNYTYGDFDKYPDYYKQQCTCLVPKIAAYDKNMFSIGQTVGKEYDTNKTGPYCIKGPDTSPNTYSGYYKVEESGVNYVAVSTSWGGLCQASSNFMPFMKDEMAKQEYDKQGIKTFVDLNVVVEGIPDPVTTPVPVIAPAPVTVPTPVVTPVVKTPKPVVTPVAPKPITVTTTETVKATTTASVVSVADTEKLVEDSQTENAVVLEKANNVAKTSNLKIFFIGVNSDDFRDLKVQLIKANNKLDKFKKALDKTNDESLQTLIQDQITETEDVIAQLETTIAEKGSRFSLFGWLFR